MSTTSINASTNTKISTIQPIEGAIGNIALYYYQGKYPIYKSMDDGMYHAKSVVDAWNGANTGSKRINNWRRLPATEEFIAYLSSDARISVSEIIHNKKQQNRYMQHLDGTYICEALLIDLAGWVSSKFRHEIYQCFARQAEIDRLNADIGYKQTKIDELTSKVDELLRINKDQTIKLDDMSYRLKKTYATVQSIADLPEKLNNNVSSGNTVENVYIYTLPDECDEESMIIHLSARTDQSLKSLQTKLPKDHTVIDHFTIANAKDCIREIIGEAESYGIVSSVRPTYSISIATEDLDTFKSAIDVILRKLNRSPKIVKRTVETTNKLNPFEYVSEKWSINETIIKDILKTHGINIETLNGLVKGDIMHRIRGKEYTVKYHNQSPYLCYGRQVDESIKWFFVRPGTLKDPA